MRTLNSALIVSIAVVGGGCVYLAGETATPSPSVVAQPTDQPTRLPMSSPSREATQPPRTSGGSEQPSTSPIPSASPSSLLPTSSPVATANGASEIVYVDAFPDAQVRWVYDIVGTSGGFMAFTQDHPGETEAGFMKRGSLWSSADGVGWSRGSNAIFDGAVLRKLIEFEGRLYAFGSFCPPDDACVAMPDDALWTVWRSEDGTTWDELPRSADLQSQQIVDVVGSGHDLIALGGASGYWRSSDGIDWTHFDPFDGDLGLFRVASDGSTMVGIAAGRGTTAALWSSEDGGQSWRSVPVPDASLCAPFDVAHAGDGFVAVGHFWPPPQSQAGACAWTSTDGFQWTGGVLQDEPVRLGALGTVAETAVAVGVEFAPDGATGRDGVVFATHGDEWRRVGSLPSYDGSGTYATFWTFYTPPFVIGAGRAGAFASLTTVIENNDETLTDVWLSWFIPPGALLD
jgi:hypothetical protein